MAEQQRAELAELRTQLAAKKGSRQRLVDETARLSRKVVEESIRWDAETAAQEEVALRLTRTPEVLPETVRTEAQQTRAQQQAELAGLDAMTLELEEQIAAKTTRRNELQQISAAFAQLGGQGLGELCQRMAGLTDSLRLTVPK